LFILNSSKRFELLLHRSHRGHIPGIAVFVTWSAMFFATVTGVTMVIPVIDVRRALEIDDGQDLEADQVDR
jgi:hypothetical protein